MKFLILLTLCIFSCECRDISNYTRIASGVPAKKGENLDYVLLSVLFQNQAQICGGVIFTPIHVLTTASCVLDPIEGVASNINITFPQSKLTAKKLDIDYHGDFDSSSNANNIAIVTLDTPIEADGKTIIYATNPTDTTSDVYDGVVMRVCGFGSTANFPTPRGFRCTDVAGASVDVCATGNANTICTEWPDRDNNVCNGDYGSPLYTYSYSPDGKTITQQAVGLASFSPNKRFNAPCLDGHSVEYTQIANYVDWILGILTPQVNKKYLENFLKKN